MIAAVICGAAAMVAVHLLLLHTYWDYSEGVYALSSHLMLHGRDLYGGMVGAQPPGVFLVGAALLAIHDGVEWLRFGIGCLQVLAGLVGARIVYRLTGNRIAAVLTPVLMVLTPWAVHEHGALTPELVALPVMLGAALLAATPGRSAWTGILCGALVLIKLPLAIPAVVLVVLAADVRRTAMAFVATLVVGFGATWAAGGSGFWRDVVVAQLHSGSRTLGELKGFWAQAAWNLLGLLFCAAAALRLRARAQDPRLLRVAVGLAVANIVTFLTNFKEGTGLNITVPVEAALVPLAVTGAAFALAAARGRVRTGWRRPRGGARWIAALCGAALAFTLAQSVSLITSPGNAVPFLRAFSAPAWGIAMTAPRFEAVVAAARTCPAGEPYAGAPLVAEEVGRTLPANQPDEFLPTHSPTLASVAAQIAAAGRHACVAGLNLSGAGRSP